MELNVIYSNFDRSFCKISRHKLGGGHLCVIFVHCRVFFMASRTQNTLFYEQAL